MVERILIFNAKDIQIGYIEGNEAFDLTGRKRCHYTGATGNLHDSNGGKIIGHVSLDGTFFGASWISDELFGKTSDEAHADRSLARTRRARHHPKKASVQRPENVPSQTVVSERPENVPLQTAVPKPSDNAAAHSQSSSKSGGNPEKTSEKVSAHVQPPPVAPQPEPINPTDSSPTETELLGRAIGMIRSALEKRPE